MFNVPYGLTRVAVDRLLTCPHLKHVLDILFKSLNELRRLTRILLENFTEMAPIVYTPTVGWACLNYHLLFRRPRGMYFSANDKGEMVRRASAY